MEPGYYWVKEFEDSPWTIAQFLGEYWLTMGNDCAENNYFFEINPKLIERPE